MSRLMMAGRQRVRNYGERLKEVEDYIGEHMDQPLDRAVLAEIAGFSVPHFHRIFTAHTGENIAGHVRRVRLERAARKLRMGAVDITEVALAAGYDTHAAFAKAFRRQFGLTPSEFRQLSCNAATELLMNTEKLK